MSSAKHLEDPQLFGAILTFFNGNHQIDENMHFENLRRFQVLTLLDKFSDVLIL